MEISKIAMEEILHKTKQKNNNKQTENKKTTTKNSKQLKRILAKSGDAVLAVKIGWFGV